MKGTRSHWRSRVVHFIVLALMIALTPLPALADQASQPAKATPSIRATAARIAASQPLAASPNSAAQKGQAGEAAPQSGAFFKSPAGIAVLAAMGLGIGYAVYSSSHDRIHSPGAK